MKALVTGASGFVGRHLVAHLADEGDEVVGCDRDSGVDVTDPSTLRDLVDRVRPDAVYHLAGYSDVGRSWDEPVEAFRVNAEGTLHVLLACSDARVDRVLCIGSADMYGKVTDAALPLREDAPLRPVSPYAASKVAADFLAVQAHLGRGLGALRVRAFNHLGPGQTERFVAAALAARIARNERDGATRVPVGNVTPRRDFTDVRDVVRAYRLLVLHGEPGQTYNVCTGRDVSIGDLAERLVGLASRPMEIERDPTLEREVDIPVLRGDPTRLWEATGWEPKITLDQTLADLLEDWRARVQERH